MQYNCTVNRYRCASAEPSCRMTAKPKHKCCSRHPGQHLCYHPGHNPESDKKAKPTPQLRPRSSVSLNMEQPKQQRQENPLASSQVRKQFYESKAHVLKDFYNNMDQKLATSFNGLLLKNRKYIQDMSKVCCKKRPSSEKFDFGMKPPYTTYEHDYPPKKAAPMVYFKHGDNLELPLEKLPGTTTHNDFFRGTPGDPSPLLRPKDTNGFEGPLKQITSYNKDYPEWGYVKPESVPQFCEPVVHGLPFNGSTIYKNSYKGQPKQRAKSAKRPDYRHGGAKVPFMTTYRKEMTPKAGHPIQSFQPFQYKVPKQGLFDTTHRDHFKNPNDLPQWIVNKCYRASVQI